MFNEIIGNWENQPFQIDQFCWRYVESYRYEVCKRNFAFYTTAAWVIGENNDSSFVLFLKKVILGIMVDHFVMTVAFLSTF